jgi:hypothetical protein
MRKIVKIGWLALGLLVASHQQTATGADHQRADVQISPSAASRAPDREVADHKRAISPSGAAQSRDSTPAAGVSRSVTAVAPAGQINHFDRAVIDAHRAASAEGQPARASAASAASAAQSAAPGLQASLKRMIPAPAARETVSQAGLKIDLKQRPADQAREPGPQAVQRLKTEVAVAPAGMVNRVDRQAVEARRRAPDAGPSLRAAPGKTPADRRLPPGQ